MKLRNVVLAVLALFPTTMIGYSARSLLMDIKNDESKKSYGASLDDALKKKAKLFPPFNTTISLVQAKVFFMKNAKNKADVDSEFERIVDELIQTGLLRHKESDIASDIVSRHGNV